MESFNPEQWEAKISHLLNNTDSDKLGEWWAICNSWKYPEDLPHCPHSFMDYTERRSYKGINYSRHVMDIINTLIGDKGCSKGWWVYNNLESETDVKWEDWYNNREEIR